ncbi:MAG: hypothetical protein ACSHXH_06140 [Marivita sp.]|uniref:hypothetical protein n=1 Tax=Marivita sp. TaxID=2003365 RepID=UPI003EFA8C1C
MRTRIFCSHAGGQGKTTAAQTVYAALRARDENVSLAAADFIDDTGSSKLGRLFPGTVRELGTGPTVALAKDANDLSANIRYWDSLGPLLLNGGHIIDMGANVIDQVLNWGEIRQAPKLLGSRAAPPIDIFLVCKSEQRSIDDMGDLVNRFSAQTSLPVNKIFVILNEQGGAFDGLDIRTRLASAAKGVELEFIELPRCTSELWVPMEQSYRSIKEVMDMDEGDVPHALTVDFWSVLSGITDLQNWFTSVQKRLKEASVF